MENFDCRVKPFSEGDALGVGNSNHIPAKVMPMGAKPLLQPEKDPIHHCSMSACNDPMHWHVPYLLQFQQTET
jgi:hypothetical protein